MKTWIGNLLSECLRVIGERSGCMRGSTQSRNDSRRRLNELHLRNLCQGWDVAGSAQSQTELVNHWTSQEAKYEAPMPTISSDTWSRFEDFLEAQGLKTH